MNANLDSLLQKARLAMRENRPADVIAACEEARKQVPDEISFVFLHGVALRREGQPESAAPLLKKVVQTAPDLGAAQHEYGLVSMSLGKLTDARRAFERAVKLDPKDSAAWLSLRDVRAAEGDDPGAAEAYRRSLGGVELAPPIKKALDAFSAGRLAIAEGICRQFLHDNPYDVNAIRLLAEVGIQLGMMDEAILLLERCLELAPDFSIARSNYATALGRKQRFPEALVQIDRLKKEQPGNLSHMVQGASVLAMAGRYPEAHAAFEEVLQRVPDNARILISYGHSLRYGGKGERAVETYLKAIEVDPGAGEAWFSLANLKTYEFTDEQVETMRSLLESLEKASADKFHMGFALGKALEDRKDYDGSFEAYAIGNAIKRRFSAYDSKRTSDRADAAIEHGGPALFDGKGHPSNAPIFIVGLPRAGSTLLEQILASHSQVEATSELPFIGQIAAELSGKRKKQDKSQYPEILAQLDDDRRYELGQSYLDRAAIHRTDAPRFIDKLPNNFLHVALIKTILPNATIVDARRMPMAACFACFKQLFARGQEFTYALEDIANYYADYIRLMDHWHTTYPGQALTVQYEDVVADLEPQVHRLLEFCGLEFEEACIRYYEKDRAVRTASSEQVRQPIYTGALKLWENYREQLQPAERVLSDRGVL